MLSRIVSKGSALALFSVAIAGLFAAGGVKQAGAKTTPMKLGTVSALANHAEANLNTGNYVLKGNVSISTQDGQSVQADSMVLTMGRNPATGKQDVSTVTAEGKVRFKARQTIEPKGLAAFVRTVSGSADKTTWRRAAKAAELTGNVTVTMDDPDRTVVWKNASIAVLDLVAGTVKADAAEGQQMSVDMHSKAAAAAPKKKP